MHIRILSESGYPSADIVAEFAKNSDRRALVESQTLVRRFGIFGYTTNSVSNSCQFSESLSDRQRIFPLGNGLEHSLRLNQH